MSSTHTLIVTHHGYDECTYRLDCADPDECFEVYVDADWPDGNSCRCTDPDDGCRRGDHYDCSEFGWSVPELGPVCRCQPFDGCGLVDWLDEVGPEMLGDWSSQLVQLRVPVEADWSAVDCPQLIVDETRIDDNTD